MFRDSSGAYLWQMPWLSEQYYVTLPYSLGYSEYPTVPAPFVESEYGLRMVFNEPEEKDVYIWVMQIRLENLEFAYFASNYVKIKGTGDGAVYYMFNNEFGDMIKSGINPHDINGVFKFVLRNGRYGLKWVSK